MVPVLFAVIRPGFLPVSRCSAWVLLILRFPLIPSLMCQCAVTENRYITDNPPENRAITRESDISDTLKGLRCPENRPITRVSAVSAVLKRHTPAIFATASRVVPCANVGIGVNWLPEFSIRSFAISVVTRCDMCGPKKAYPAPQNRIPNGCVPF